AGVEQVIDRGLDDVEGIAQFVSDATGHLTNRRQSFAALQASGVFGLVSVLDDGQVQIEQLVERANRVLQVLRVAPPFGGQNAYQSCSQPRESSVGIDLFQSNLDVAPANLPTSGDIVEVVTAAEQFAQPLHQGALEAVDLCLSPGDDFAGVGMTVNLVV